MKRKTLIRRIKRFLKKHDFYINPMWKRGFTSDDHVMFLGENKKIHACYEYSHVFGVNEISRFFFFDQFGLKTGLERDYLKWFDCFYGRDFVNLALEIFGLESIFILPKKHAPLIISMKDSDVFFYIAPRQKEDDLYGKSWKEVTGCKCPHIYKNRNFW